jgi:hypothetical protein
MSHRQQSGSVALAWILGLSLGYAGIVDAAGPCGDYDGNQSINASDALGALRTAVGLVQCPLDVCDFNGDQSVTTADALAILKTAVGIDIKPKCPVTFCKYGDLDCCDRTTCSGHGVCAVEDELATCTCDEDWVGATCNARADLYPFATAPVRTTPTWTAVGGLFVRPPSYREQMLYDLRPGTFFIANATLVANVTAGKASTSLPLVFPDGTLDRFSMELKDTYTSEVRLIDRHAVGSIVKITNRFPKVSIYRSLYEADGSVRSVMQILAVDDGGFVSRGLVRHESNLPKHAGVFGLTVSPVSSSMELDDISPVNGTIDEPTLLMSEAYFANTHQAELYDDCDGLSICSDLCADTGLDQGEPGPACPPPPDPCEHVSPCGEGNGPGVPAATHQCNDGEDNDGDDVIDGFDPQCDHSPSCEPGGDIPQHVHTFEAGADFGMFGDVVWCTNHGDNWPSNLLDRGYSTETAFHTNTGWAAYDNLYKWGDGFYSRYEKLVRLKTIGCWRLVTADEALDCANHVEDCGAFASGPHTYPYHFGREAAAMWDGVKVDVWHARSVGLNDPLNAAQVVAGALASASEAESIPGFASAAGANNTGPSASPHELGHSLNLTHCDVRKVGNLWTLMGNPLQVQTCPPGGEYGSEQLNQFSNVSGEKLYNCFIDGCLSNPRFGDPSPD